jgi:hypothetical protein
MRALALLPLLSLLLLLSSSTPVNAVDPACTNMQAYGFSELDVPMFGLDFLNLLDCTIFPQPCLVCGQKDTMHNNSAQKTQADMIRFGTFFLQHNCWGNRYAFSPSSDTDVVPAFNDFISDLCRGACDITPLTSAPCAPRPTTSPTQQPTPAPTPTQQPTPAPAPASTDSSASSNTLSQTNWILLCVAAFVIGLASAAACCRARRNLCQETKISTAASELTVPLNVVADGSHVDRH